jgi:hypothetical protein
MALRTLKRKVIIREYDFNKVAEDATETRYDGHALYDRVSFLPLNQENLEKLKVVELLKGKEHTPLVKSDWNDNIPAMLLYQLKDYLYDNRYYDWRVTIDGEGYLCVQSRKNTPKTRLGWGIFEKDLPCRI